MASNPYAVLQSTGTIIGVHPDHPYLVGFVSTPDKHQGRPVLPGGRQQDESFMNVLIREFSDEAGGLGGKAARLGRVRVIAVALDRYRDVRHGKTFGYVTEGRSQPDLADIVAPFAYGCPDWIGFAPIYGVPAPNAEAATADGQSESIEKVEFLDVRNMAFTLDPAKSFLGAGHDVPVDMYRRLILPQVMANRGEWIVDEPNDSNARVSVLSGVLILPDFEQYRLEHFS